MSLRAILSIANGAVSPFTWFAAARAEPPVSGNPIGCAGCPLRPGGEWEAGLAAALPRMSSARRHILRHWGCHASSHPCAGMRRMLTP